MKRIRLFGATACVLLAGNAEAANCRPKVVRARSTKVLVASEALFAVPVATVVVAVQPSLYYSYRAAARSAPSLSPLVDVDGAADSLRRTAATILRERCVSCHQGDAPKGGLAFFDNDGALFQALPRRAMLEMASPNPEGVARMPPGEAAQLNAVDLAILRQWAEPPRDLRY